MTEEQNETYAENQDKTVDNTLENESQEHEEDAVTEASQEESQIDALQASISRLEKERDDHKDRAMRAQAEMENFRRRTREEKARAAKYQVQSLAEKLLPVLDNFEHGLNTKAESADAKSVMEGMNIVYRQLKDALEEENIKEIEAEGLPFDPQYHQAIMEVDSDDHDSNRVVEVVQKGYILNDRIIRPAMVKVAS